MTIAEFDFLIESSSLCKFKDHISHIFVLVIVVVEEMNDIRVIKLMMDINFLFCIFTMNLYLVRFTILMATTSPVSVFLASLTSP